MKAVHLAICYRREAGKHRYCDTTSFNGDRWRRYRTIYSGGADSSDIIRCVWSTCVAWCCPYVRIHYNDRTAVLVIAVATDGVRCAAVRVGEIANVIH